MHKVYRVVNNAACSYIIETYNGIFLVDTGMLGGGKRILKKMETLNLNNNALKAAFITHGHADHYGGLREILDFNPDIKVISHPKHKEIISKGEAIVSPAIEKRPFAKIYEDIAIKALPKIDLPKVNNVYTKEHGERVDEDGLAGKVIHTPGHSTGDLTLILDNGAAFVGDLIQGPDFRTRVPLLPGMALNTVDVLKSWEKILNEDIDIIYPAHGGIMRREEVEKALPHLWEIVA